MRPVTIEVEVTQDELFELCNGLRSLQHEIMDHHDHGSYDGRLRMLAALHTRLSQLSTPSDDE